MRFDLLNVLSLKEFDESNDLRKVIEIREKVIFVVNKDFSKKTKCMYVNNSKFEKLIKTTHQNIIQSNLIFSLRFDKNFDKCLLKIANVLMRQSIILNDHLFDATLLKNFKNFLYVIANDEIRILNVYFNLATILSFIVANAIFKILKQFLKVK